MGRLTLEERRRNFLARQEAREGLLHLPVSERGVPTGAHLGARQFLKIATLVVLLASGLLAYQLLEFHPPASILEMFLP